MLLFLANDLFQNVFWGNINWLDNIIHCHPIYFFPFLFEWHLKVGGINQNITRFETIKNSHISPMKRM